MNEGAVEEILHGYPFSWDKPHHLTVIGYLFNGYHVIQGIGIKDHKCRQQFGCGCRKEKFILIAQEQIRPRIDIKNYDACCRNLSPGRYPRAVYWIRGR